MKERKDLTARLLNPPLLKKDLAAKQKLSDDWKRYAKLHPLGLDGRLHAKLTVVELEAWGLVSASACSLSTTLMMRMRNLRS